MSYTWKLDTRVPVLDDAGDVGGDIQAGKAYSVRFLAVEEPDDGLHALVDSYWYATIEDDETFYRVQNQLCRTLCHNIEDPGGTEEWADYEYGDSGGRFTTFAEADAAALRFATDEAAHAGNFGDVRFGRAGHE